MARQKLIHIHSNATASQSGGGGGVAKSPQISDLEYGEIAVNYNEDDPSLFIKSSGSTGTTISKFSSDKQILSIIDENEEVIAAALNDLEANKQDKLTAGSGITIENNVISSSSSGGLNETVVLHISSTIIQLQSARILVKNKADNSIIHTLNWIGEDLIFYVKDGVNYTIEFSDNNDFVTPETLEYTAFGDLTRNINAVYIAKYEQVNLSISIDQGTLPNPITITVVNNADSSVIHNLSWTGNDLQFLIEGGIEYKIIYGNIGSNFYTPNNYIETAIRSNQRNVEGSYVSFVNGFFIAYSDKSISPYNDRDVTKNPVGVVIKTDDSCIILHPDFTSGFVTWDEGMNWANGKQIIFDDGTIITCHLTTRSELTLLRINAETINIALSGWGTGVYYGVDNWTSELASSSNAYRWNCNGGYWASVPKYGGGYCRAVADFSL